MLSASSALNRRRRPGTLPKTKTQPQTKFFVNDKCGICTLRPAKGRIEIGAPGLQTLSCRVCAECGNMLQDLLREHGFAGLHAIITKNLASSN